MEHNDVEAVFDYDIFLSYRYHDESDPAHPKRGVGKKLSRNLYKKFEKEGYRVWYDKGDPIMQSYVNMLKSKLCIILISDYSLAGINWDDKINPSVLCVSDFSDEDWLKITDKDAGGEGFHKELVAAYHLLNDNRYNKDNRKTRILFVSIDNGLQAYTDKDPKFRWIKDWHTYENYHNFGRLLKRIKGRDDNQFDIQPMYKYRKLYGWWKKIAIILICLLLFFSLIIHFAMSPNYIIVGPGSVSEYLSSKGVKLFARHTYYFHQHSDGAWKSLRTFFRYDTKGGQGKLPIALSDREMDTTIANKILGDKKHNHRILQIFIDSIDLEVLVLQDTTKRPVLKVEEFADTTVHLIDTNVLKKWYNKRDSLNLFIVANSPQSTTREIFTSFLCLKDGKHQDPMTLSCDREFRKYDTNDCYAAIKDALVKDGLRTVLVLDNSTIENERDNIVDSSLAVQHFTVVGEKIPLFLYTIVEIKDNNYIIFLNKQEFFFKYILRMKIDNKFKDLKELKNLNRDVPTIIKKDCAIGEDIRFITKLYYFFMSI